MEKITRFKDIPKFVHGGNYVTDVDWDYIEDWLITHDKDGLYNLELDPDFQRGHVWTTDKQIAYVEYILRGGVSSRQIYFNHPNWMNSFEGSLQLVDGKQRLEAARAFMSNKIPAFGSFFEEYEDRLRGINASFKISINNLPTRADVLQWYLDLNTGGVVHTTDELEKVRVLLAQEKNK